MTDNEKHVRGLANYYFTDSVIDKLTRELLFDLADRIEKLECSQQ